MRSTRQLLPLAALVVLVVSASMPARASAQVVVPELDAAPFRAEARPFAGFSASAERLRDSIVSLARAQIGRRYVRGGATPDRGFDCSGLVRYVMAALSLDLPRTAREQARVGDTVARDKTVLRPGDLLTFGKGTRATHIGIYVGDGRFVHASSVAGRVVESPLERGRSPLIKPWRGARRMVATEPSR